MNTRTRIWRFSGPRERVEINARITPQQMRPESWLGAHFSRKPRYDGPTAEQLNYATYLCFQRGMSWAEAIAAVEVPGRMAVQPARVYSAEMLAALPPAIRRELLAPGQLAITTRSPR